MDDEFNDVTKAGYEKLEQEIEDLKASRPEKIKILAAARALGDLSENAEYSAAKRDLRHLESRLRFLTKQLQYARVYEPSDNDIVEIGKTVTFQYLDDNDTDTYEVVGTPEVDIDHGKISIASPIGAALMNHKTGDTITVSAPNNSFKVKIIKITR
ncbi:transcription elongation factor GreA [Lentilactobacillus curieae]|uniref:Transcription elongation factor GreA n=1 Tax=Lentilactobacillus curieae TaxID=1138822 RepID=A0A1S6QGY2_9LACO|nr:transcription elongation factor GreA [Lentilactobacillus curieae]AQW20868.1 transcription elongation factor GreA [Lentilactobacillus curieae]